jgi:hypothetical protein
MHLYLCISIHLSVYLCIFMYLDLLYGVAPPNGPSGRPQSIHPSRPFRPREPIRGEAAAAVCGTSERGCAPMRTRRYEYPSGVPPITLGVPLAVPLPRTILRSTSMGWSIPFGMPRSMRRHSARTFGLSVCTETPIRVRRMPIRVRSTLPRALIGTKGSLRAYLHEALGKKDRHAEALRRACGATAITLSCKKGD